MRDLMQPIVTSGGTSREQFIETRIMARVALAEAMRAIGETTPNGRDYIANPTLYERDKKIYQKRFEALLEIYNDLFEEAAELQREA